MYINRDNNRKKGLLFLVYHFVAHVDVVQHQIVEHLFERDSGHGRVEHVVHVDRHRGQLLLILVDVDVLPQLRILLQVLQELVVVTVKKKEI